MKTGNGGAEPTPYGTMPSMPRVASNRPPVRTSFHQNVHATAQKPAIHASDLYEITWPLRVSFSTAEFSQASVPSRADPHGDRLDAGSLGRRKPPQLHTQNAVSRCRLDMGKTRLPKAPTVSTALVGDYVEVMCFSV